MRQNGLQGARLRCTATRPCSAPSAVADGDHMAPRDRRKFYFVLEAERSEPEGRRVKASRVRACDEETFEALRSASAW
jgi:hypothetical protein